MNSAGSNQARFDQSELDEIAESFSNAIRRGEKPSIKTYLSKHPDPSGQLRSLLESIELIESLKQDPLVATRSPRSDNPHIEQLDDYTIVREIGRGGMGVVFEAIHQSLGRRVALKVLASSLLGDSKHLSRFRREARAAARLRHTNIVPVFGVGSSGEHHYYVMDFIDGMSLSQWLNEFAGVRHQNMPTVDLAMADTDGDLVTDASSRHDLMSAASRSDSPPTPTSIDAADYFPWVARLGATICDALQYAHAHGVLHRDIKPANLLIDQSGEVWIADFGLAKLTEQQAMTMTGDIVGTPQYMPPESFEGTYDVRSEIYGVGLTLYELLTLRPAIQGKNPGDVIRKATDGVSIPPRKIQGRVPRDLETIVLKALSHDPQGRYASAGHLRDDLQNFVMDRPISARRSSLVERAVRWSRREPVVAILTFATFTLLLALAIVSAAGYLRTRDALDVAQSATLSAENSLEQRTAALQLADEQRLRAETNLQVAIAAFDQIMRNITDRGIESDAEFLGEVTDTTSPNVTPEDAKLLQSLLGFFDELAANNSEELLSESATAARFAGEIYQRLGQLRQADRAYSDALERYRRLAQRGDDSLDSILARAEIMNELAVITSLRGELGRANAMFNQVKTLVKESDAAMASPNGQFAYARAHRIFASLGARIGLDALPPGPRQPLARAPVRAPRRPIEAMLRIRTEDELQAVTEAITVLDNLIELAPQEIRYRAELARAYRDKAKVASRANRRSESEDAVRRSIELFEQLLSDNKDSEAIRYELALTLASTEAFSFDQMLRALRANELSSALLAKSPTVPRYQALKAHALETLASHQRRVGKLDAAERNLGETMRIYNSLLADSPELSLYETQRSQALESMAEVKLRQGDADAAIEHLERAIRQLQATLRRPDSSPMARIPLLRMKQKLSRIRESS